MATPKVRQYKITFKNIKEGEIPCSNPVVKLFDIADNIVQKCEFKNNSVYFSIYEDAIEGLQGTCIQYSIVCESCGKCPQKNGKLCFCNNFTDCEECQDCINGICVNRCPNQLCVDDRCVDCENDSSCPNNQICIGGKCQCPPAQPYFNEETQKCYGCNNDGECGPCYRCVDGNCLHLNCICNEALDKCVECNQSSDCPLPNQICKNNKCECAPGYIYDHVLDECVEEPECTTDEDCNDPCKMCVNGECVDIPCPLEEEVCIDGDCVPIPCEGACDDATDCGPNCGCLNGECVDCASLDCVTCAETIGCKCVNGNCQKDDSPCAQYSCDTNCGERPDCECQEDGSCEEVECEGESTLAKNEEECKLEYNLSTTKCCECSPITLNNKLLSAQILPNGTMKLATSVEVRKGSVTTALGILNLHRVDEDQYDDIMDNEEPTQGVVQVKATYVYENLGPCAGAGCVGTPTGVITNEEVILTPSIDVAGVGFKTVNLYINIPGRQYPTAARILRSVILRYTLISELTFESECVYDQGEVIGTYVFTDVQTETALASSINTDTPGQDSNVAYWIAKTLTSDACRVPEAKWYKAPANEDGGITTFEEVPFRKAYLTKLTPTTYTDFIDEPDENPGPTDNNGELFSGYFYKVATDCACINEATAYYESSCENPGRLVFCDPAEAEVEFDECGKKFTFTAPFTTDCLPNYDYYGDNADFVPDGAKLRYSIYVNGSTEPVAGSLTVADASGVIYGDNQEFTSSELIEFIEIKFSHDNCDECTIRLESDVEKGVPSYIVSCEPSGAGDTTYTITFTFPADVTEIVVGSNTATPGSPIISVTVANTVTELEMEITYDGCSETVIKDISLPENCCDDLVVNLTQDSSNCSSENYNFVAVASPPISGSYAFSKNNVFVESNSTGLFETPKNIGGDEPNTIKVVFTPTSASCDAVNKTINVDKSFSFGLTSASPSIITVCSTGATSTNIVYSVPNGVTGNVTYNITGAADATVAVNGPTPLTINVPGTPTQTKVLSIVSNTLVDGTGNGCAVFTPEPITINFITSPSISGITVLPADPCEEASVSVTVNGTAGAVATMNISNIIGTWTGFPNMTVGTTYTLTAGAVGNLTVAATNVAAGTCSVPSSASTTVVVKDKPEITSVQFDCATPGSPSSLIDVVILGTTGSVVKVNLIAIPEASPGSYEQNGLSASLGGTSAVISITKNGCSDSQEVLVPACACDAGATATIHLGSTGGPSITTDDGCEGDVQAYAATTTGLNGDINYEWWLDAIDSGTLLDTDQTMSPGYTFDDDVHTLYVQATDENGCIVTDSITVTGSPLPVFTVNIPEEMCVGELSNITYTITEGTVATRQWKLDGINVSTAVVYPYTPVDTDPHDISLTITTSGPGCVAEVIEEATAVDCCEVCTTQTVIFQGEGYNWSELVDESSNTHIIGGGSGVEFECLDAGVTVSVLNDASRDTIEDAINAISGQCGTATVTWETANVDNITDCKDLDYSIAAPPGTGTWLRQFAINGTFYNTSIKIANWSGGIPTIIGGSEASVEAFIIQSLFAEGINVIDVNAEFENAGGGTPLHMEYEILGIDSAHSLIISIADTATGPLDQGDTFTNSCSGLAGDSQSGTCILLTITGSSIIFDHIDDGITQYSFDTSGC